MKALAPVPTFLPQNEGPRGLPAPAGWLSAGGSPLFAVSAEGRRCPVGLPQRVAASTHRP